MKIAKEPDCAAWYLAQIKPGAHALAVSNLRRQGFEAFAPWRSETQRTRTGFKTKRLALFSGYLFVEPGTDPGAIRAINGTPGVNKLVQFGSGGPARVPGALIAGLRRRYEDGENTMPQSLAPGSVVRIVRGPFANLIATVEAAPVGQRTWVLLDFLGRQLRASTVNNDVILLEAAAPRPTTAQSL